MKLQSLAIIFIIIILPISLLLEAYTKSRIETISIQSQYDSKLMDATYDAIKAYQLNSFSNTEDSLANSKIRDIKASVNTFYNSISTNFSSLGYSKSALQNYVPALVYTMYDGYYIYGPFTNTWDKDYDNTSYSRNEIVYGLKPYVYYSCRYRDQNNPTINDVVITYSLDNYIQIQGKINGISVSKYGYILGGTITETSSDIKYTPYGTSTAITIQSDENLTEKVFINNQIKELPYIKENGTKYYKYNNKYYYILNGKYIEQTTMNEDEFKNNQAKNYYKKAKDIKDFLAEENWINTTNIYSAENGYNESKNYQDVGSIFTGDVDAEDSNFNTHRMDVIKNSINKNLSVAISNYNHYYNTSTDFQMPKLKETDWDKLTDNISMISFMQGMNIGGKIYNGYAIVNNNKNLDVVMEDSIYIKTNDEVVHKITEKGLKDKINNITDAIGIFNINIERRSAQSSDGNNTVYYYPVKAKLSYESIVTQDAVAKANKKDNLTNSTLASIYYTALGRERYSLYRPKVEY